MGLSWVILLLACEKMTGQKTCSKFSDGMFQPSQGQLKPTILELKPMYQCTAS